MIAPLISPSTFYRAVRRQMFFRHLGVHRFDDDNRVINHHANGQTSANSVIRLMVIPKTEHRNVPMRDTGTASVGISVERQSPRNTNTTSATRTNASNKV